MKIITLLALLSIAGCGDMVVIDSPQVDNNPNSSYIFVSITDCNDVKLYSGEFPLLYVQHFGEITTNSNGDFNFNYSLPDGWGLLFESETICFNSVNSGTVKLNFNENTYYQFAITTQ